MKYLGLVFVTSCLPGPFSPYRLIRMQWPSHWCRLNSILRVESNGEDLSSMISPSADVLANKYYGTGERKQHTRYTANNKHDCYKCYTI